MIAGTLPILQENNPNLKPELITQGGLEILETYSLPQIIYSLNLRHMSKIFLNLLRMIKELFFGLELKLQV